MRSSFEHYGADPRRNNTVPGQFSEWFDGESLVNKGMRLWPWEPPRFLWAAIEGVCGLILMPGKPRINPLIPRHWSWIALRRLPYHGGSITYFAVRQNGGAVHLCSTAPLDSDADLALYDRDVSDDVGVFAEGASIVALAREGQTVVMVGNTDAGTINAPLNLSGALKPSQRYAVRVYNSDRHDWDVSPSRTAEDLAGIAIAIEAGGFRLIELTAAS